jgi:hypothetical protein
VKRGLTPAAQIPCTTCTVSTITHEAHSCLQIDAHIKNVCILHVCVYVYIHAHLYISCMHAYMILCSDIFHPRDSEAALYQQLPCQALCRSRQILIRSRSTVGRRKKKAFDFWRPRFLQAWRNLGLQNAAQQLPENRYAVPNSMVRVVSFFLV